MTLLEIPIDVRYRMPLPFLTPYVMAGPVLRFPSGDEAIKDNLKEFSLAGSLGVGVEVSLLGLRSILNCSILSASQSLLKDLR